MCGLAGFAGDVGLGEADVERMCDAVRHRGPDGEGLHHESGRVGLGFRRLSIIDLEGGQQPLVNEDGRVRVTCNGEIYNFRELAAGLRCRGHELATGSDAEVIAHLYEERGADFLSLLEGMFAIALWDAREGVLLLARDRIGVKPLYWAPVDGGLVYGSEPGAVLASGLLEPVPDLDALLDYLTLQYVPPPRSGFAGIHKLHPGERLRLADGRVEVERYWRLEYPPRVEDMRDEDALERLDGLLRQATEQRLISDVPLGAFLSGGLDSSVVVSYMAEALPSVRTFSIDFPVAKFSEGQQARRVAELYGTRHEQYVVEPAILPVVAETVRRLGEPFADSSAIPTLLLSEITRRSVTVALSGDGGDEAFGGYVRYQVAGAAERFGPLPRAIGRPALALLGPPLGARWPRVRRGLDALARSPHDRYAALMAHFSPQEIRALCCPELLAAASNPEHAWNDVLALPAVAGVNKYMALDIETYLPGDILTKVDRMSMAHALEVRSPLLDHRVHEFAARLPPRLKLRRGRKKWLLKALAARRRLPEDLVERPKQGFGVPLASWFRAELRPWLEDVLRDPATRSRAYFEPSAVDRLLEDHLSGRSDHSPRLWNLLMLELWHREWIDG